MSSNVYGSIPDLISSSVTVNLENVAGSHGRDYHESKKHHTSGTIYPLTPQRSLLWTMVSEIRHIVKYQEAKKILMFLCLNFFGTFVLLLWCHGTNSMALTAYTYLTIYDILSLLICLLSVWVKRQRPTPAFTFGYERFEVLAVFASTMLAQLGALFVVKESIERLLVQPDIHTGRMIIGTVVAFALHMFVSYSINNRAMNHVIDASSSSWLQEHMTDMSESLCHVIPGLSKLLLPRLNPMALIGFAGGFAIVITYILIDNKMYHAADTWAAISIAFMTCGTMFPMSVYTGKILLQTTPSHILGQLDKLLREASTLDGVLEFRHEHFWTLSFGTLAGSVQVRVRRDADEQMVLAHVYNRLSNLVTHLTVQIFKDDWTRTSSYNILGSHAFPSGFPASLSPSQPRGPSPVIDSMAGTGSSYRSVPTVPPAVSPFETQSRYHSHDFKTSTPLRGTNLSSPVNYNPSSYTYGH